MSPKNILNPIAHPKMEKSKIRFFTAIAIAFIFIGGVFLYQKYLRGIWPAINPPSKDVVNELKKSESGPFSLPPGFSISVFAKDLPGARVMLFDTFQNMWVSQTRDGKISLLEIDKEDGLIRSQDAVFNNLRNPHGLAFDPDFPFSLFIAEEDKISRVAVYSEGDLEKVADLPAGAGHFTRTIVFGPDKRLYASIGSSCNVCHETDKRRASIISMKSDGSEIKTVARGLRNSVFFIWDRFNQMWMTEMGRDWLGDDLPPDEINIIKEGVISTESEILNFGWPICYGKNIHDTDFDKNTYIRNPCMEPFEKSSFADIKAHSAPLGLVFAPQTWPEEYRGNILVALHGSWNRSEPTGYKIIQVKLDKEREYLGQSDFITGWLENDGGVIGRPVDLKIDNAGNLYISDDKAGVIYKVKYDGE